MNSSTVYDLFELEEYMYPRYSYLYSCFGRDPTVWLRESPERLLARLADNSTTDRLPRLLNVDAEYDVLLIPQCRRVCRTRGVRSRVAAGVGHLGIVWNFGVECDFYRIVVRFVESSERDDDDTQTI